MFCVCECIYNNKKTMDSNTCNRLKAFWDDLDAKDTSLLDRVLTCHAPPPKTINKQHDHTELESIPARATCTPTPRPIYSCDPVIRLGFDAEFPPGSRAWWCSGSYNNSYNRRWDQQTRRQFALINKTMNSKE